MTVAQKGSGVTLPGSHKNHRPLVTCSKCGKQAEQASGVQISQTRWRCYSCWRLLK